MTITGGKWTTFRLMAEATMDQVCQQLEVERPCTTATTPVPGVEQGHYWLGHRLEEVEAHRLQGNLVCECELVTRTMIENAVRHNPTLTLDDLRRDVRLGKGPCQGGFCTYRATGILHEMAQAGELRHEMDEGSSSAQWNTAYLQSPSHNLENSARHAFDLNEVPSPHFNPNLLLRDFVQERWKGLTPILWGRQLKQERLDELIYLSLMNVDHLPEPDLASPVIGAGLSGLTAAYTAAKAGLKVKVVAKGLGALHWSAGTIDVLGYMPGDTKPVQRPLTTLDLLPGEHPYRLADASKALEAFQALTDSLGLSYGRLPNDENWLLPSPVGAARPAFLAPKAQQAGSLRSNEPMVIVGFHSLRDFYPQLIAENLTKQGHQARAEFLPLTLITDRHDSNTIQLAQGLEDAGQRKKLGQALKKLVKSGERLGLPAILGLDNHTQVWTDLQSQAGAPLFEIPTLPPSVPGVRLFRALRQQLRQMGVRIEAGMEVLESSEWRVASSKSPAANNQQSATKIEWVATETSARPLKHRAQAFLLATGGILGGGFNSDVNGRVWETIFHLPLTTPQKRPDWFRATFLDPLGHPVFQGGVAVGPDFRPVDETGQPIFANLYAAGSTLAHCDPVLERSLEGTAVVSGMAAAQAIIESLKVTA
jgi:anaerobic glycerol-3-phosphate dehydrogenase B subunit